MPNWCNNNLVIFGSTQEVNDFLETQFSIEEETKEKYLDFGKLIPEPTFNNEEEEKEFWNNTSGWYDWRVNNWGVKWNSNNNWINITEDAGDGYKNVEINFDTAWTTPTAWFEKLCEKYPTLDMELNYHEGGMGFRGFITNVNGVAQDSCWDMTEEDYKELGYEEEQDSDDEEVELKGVFHDMDLAVDKFNEDMDTALGKEK